MYRSEQAYKQI